MYSTPDSHPLGNKNPHDVNAIRIDKRYNMCTTQGVWIELLHWWSSKYRLRHIGVGSMDPSSMIPGCAKTYDNFPLIFLLEEAALLLEYKKRAQGETGKALLAAALTIFIIRYQMWCTSLKRRQSPIGTI